jgi:hypothetical protein
MLEIGVSKRPRGSNVGWADLFPYYAGYPETFARDILQSARLPECATVFDPWNGSGSTTSAAATLGLRAIGYDLNPVMSIVAKARLLPASEAGSLRPLSRRIILNARATKEDRTSDPLGEWMAPASAGYFRALERSIREHLVEETSAGAEVINNLSCVASVFYVALFSAARRLCKRFRSSNPTWIKSSRGEMVDPSRSDIDRAFLDAVERAREACRTEPLSAKRRYNIQIRTADSSLVAPEQNSVDFVLSSPPYCTRLDYTAATRIELAVIEPLCMVSRKRLSASMLGSVRVPKEYPSPNRSWGRTAINFLKIVRDHPSHASSTYYLKSHLDYFAKYERSINRLRDAIKPGGSAVFVVQDSRYKGVLNDLQSVTIEMCESRGLELIQRRDHRFSRSMRDVNTRSKHYSADHIITESTLVFRKLVSA